MAVVGSAEIRITPNSTGFASDLEKQVSSTLGRVGQTASRAVSDAFKLTGTGVLLGGAAIAASLAGFAGYQQNLNLLGATAHASALELARADTVSKQLGADLTLPATSAADAARAMTELARGGLDATNAINAAKGSLQLAAAANVDVATSSLIVAKNLNAFHLAGTDATKVVDILTNAYTHAGVALPEFAGALSNVSAVANLNGISLADTATAIALLTKNGVEASQAGTELRAVILRLAAANGPAQKEIDKLGINIFDAKGKMLPFRDIIDLLAKATKNLSQEQQDQAFKQIFGNRAIGEALILAKGGTESFDQMSKAINTSGSAADIAGARMKGLSGTLEGIKSQVETVGISFGQVLAPAAQGVLNVLTGVSVKLTDFSTAVSTALTPAVVTQYTDAISAGAGRVAAAFHGIEGPAIGAATAIGSIFASQIPLVGAFVPQISLVSGVMFGVIAQSKEARDALLGFGKTLFAVGKEQAPAVLDALREINKAAGPAFAALFNGASEAARILGPVLGDAARALGPPIADLITSIGDLAHASLPALAQAAAGLAPLFTGALKIGLEATATALGFIADHAKIVVPLLVAVGAGFAAVKVAEVAGAAVTGFVKAIALLPANLSAVNPVLLGIGVTVTALTAIFLANAAKANANKKAINDFRDAILDAGNAVTGTQNRIAKIVQSSDGLQQVLVDAKTNAEALGASLAGSDADFQAFADRLVTAKIATSGLSDTMQANLTKALSDSGGDLGLFTDKLRAFSALGENTNAIDQFIQDLEKLRDQQQKGADKADLAKKALDGQTKAHDDAAGAADKQRRALDDLASATLAAIDSSIRDARNRTEANRAVQDATKAYGDYLKVLGDPTHTAQDAQAAQRGVEDANNRVTDSLRSIGAGAVEAAQNQAVLEGKSKETVDAFTVYKQAVNDAAQANKDLAPAADGVIKQFEATAKRAPAAGQALGAGITAGIASGLGAGTGQDLAAMNDLVAQLNDPAIVAAARAAGVPVGAGIVNGIAAGIQAGNIIVSALHQTVSQAIEANKSFLGIQSPSKKMADEIGRPLAQGVVVGILAAIPESIAAGQAVVSAVAKGLAQTKSQIQDELKSIGDQIQAKVSEIRGTSQALADAARVNAGVAAAIPFPELVALEVAKRVQDAKSKSSSDDVEKAIQQQVNAQLASQGIAGTGAGAQDPKALFWISVNGEQQLFQGTESQAIARAKQLGGLETPIIQGLNAPGDAEARNAAQSAASQQALTDANAAAAHQTQQLFDHQLITAQQYLGSLNDQLGKLTPLTDDYFRVLDQITAVNKSITDKTDAAARDQSAQLDAILHREQLMYDHQMLAADQFLADLQSRAGQVTQFSDAYFALLDEIKKVQADQLKQATGKTFLVKIDNNGQNLDERRLAELLDRTQRITPDAFASTN